MSGEGDRPNAGAGEPPLVLLTGPAGAGLSTALNALEDLGFEAIDNLPLSLLPRLLDSGPLARPLALTLDNRNRDFDEEAFRALLTDLRAEGRHAHELVFLDCREDVLLRRFSETRRRHPFSQDGAPAMGIRRELAMVGPLREIADRVIDTSDLTPHDLKALLARHFGQGRGPGLRVSVESFSFKRGTPQDLDLVFDVRFLANPHWEPDLRALDGRDRAVADHVAADPRFAPFLDRVRDLLQFLLPAYVEEGKTHLAIGFGCTGGRHRSVALAENLSATLADAGWQVSTRHRGLEGSGRSAAPVEDEEDQT